MAFTFQITNFQMVENGLQIQVNWNGTPLGIVVRDKAAAIESLQNNPMDQSDLFWFVMRCWQSHDPTFANPNLIMNKILTVDFSSTTTPAMIT